MNGTEGNEETVGFLNDHSAAESSISGAPHVVLQRQERERHSYFSLFLIQDDTLVWKRHFDEVIWRVWVTFCLQYKQSGYSTDVPAYSDTLRTWEKCHCKQMSLYPYIASPSQWTLCKCISKSATYLPCFSLECWQDKSHLRSNIISICQILSIQLIFHCTVSHFTLLLSEKSVTVSRYFTFTVTLSTYFH